MWFVLFLFLLLFLFVFVFVFWLVCHYTFIMLILRHLLRLINFLNCPDRRKSRQFRITFFFLLTVFVLYLISYIMLHNLGMHSIYIWNGIFSRNHFWWYLLFMYPPLVYVYVRTWLTRWYEYTSSTTNDCFINFLEAFQNRWQLVDKHKISSSFSNTYLI